MSDFSIDQGHADCLTEAVSVLTESFADDAFMRLFFGPPTPERPAVIHEFFAILMSARLALGVPVFMARQDGRIVGSTMGYGVSRPEWPNSSVARWTALESSVPGLAERFAIYEEAAEQFMPAGPHAYLGVIGVGPAHKGRGIGSALLRHYCDQADADPESTGTYLETGDPRNVAFYQRHGFEVRGEAPLRDDERLWAMFRPRFA